MCIILCGLLELSMGLVMGLGQVGTLPTLVVLCQCINKLTICSDFFFFFKISVLLLLHKCLLIRLAFCAQAVSQVSVSQFNGKSRAFVDQCTYNLSLGGKADLDASWKAFTYYRIILAYVFMQTHQ